MRYEAARADEDIVTLTQSEYDDAFNHGLSLRGASLAHGLTEAHGFSGDGGDIIQAQGAVAEYVVCKHLGVPWEKRAFNFKAPDIGDDIQVRYMGKPWYGLRVRNDDSDEERFVAVVPVEGLSYRVAGWVYGKEAKSEQYLIPGDPSRPPMYSVPQRDLRRVPAGGGYA